MRRDIPISAGIAGSQLFVGLLDATLVKIKGELVDMHWRGIPTGKVGGQGNPMVMFMSWAKEKAENIAINSNTLWFGRKPMADYPKVGLSIILMASGTITALRTWLRCLESIIVRGLLLSLISNGFSSWRLNYQSSNE